MKDPSLSRRRKSTTTPKKLKLVCSFNGSFHRSPPPSENIRYTGGETRIITVDRSIGFSKLKSKLLSDLPLVRNPNNNKLSLVFSIKHLHLPCKDYVAPLLPVESDDDVSCMVSEHEKLELLGKPARIWIYVCTYNCDGFGPFGLFGHSMGKLGSFEKMGNGSGVSLYGFGVNSVSGYGSYQYDCDNEVKKSVEGVSDDFWRKVVMMDRDLGLGFDQNEVKFRCGMQNRSHICLPPGCLSPREFKFGGSPFRSNVLGYGFWNTHFQTRGILGENLVPGCHFHGGIRNHRVPPADFRSYRSSSYYLRSHRNGVAEMGNHRNLRWEGRPWVRKLHPGLWSSSSISKQGQAMRLSYPSLWKLWSGYHLHTSDSGLNDQTCSFDQPCTNRKTFTSKSDYGGQQLQQQNPEQLQFAYNGESTGRDGQPFLPPIVANNLLTSKRAMDPEEDLFTGSIGGKPEVPCQNFMRVLSSQSNCTEFEKESGKVEPMVTTDICCSPKSNCIDFEKESEKVEPMVTIDICGSPIILGSGNGTKSGIESEMSDIALRVNPFSKHRNGDHVMPGGLASVVDISLRNLSLSSDKEVQPMVCTSGSNDVSEALLKPHSKHVDLMVEELLTSHGQVGSNGASIFHVHNNPAKLEKVDEQEEKMQQNHPSNLSVDKQADIGEFRNCSKGNGSIPGDLLQTIKNSDLEYIKELGSGTYGSVFHGRWKGCDVAIKKFKPSCFAEGAQDQDRLVADFWKEAHILGQLRHPHIMALYGVVTDGPVTNLAAVTEYMVNGSLKQVLRRKDRTIDRRKRLIIAMDAAFGMEYLHERNIVHFDLKSHNLLVNMRDPQRPLCKIGDFGLSKVKQRTLVSGGVRGTIPWMAPELLNCQKNMVTDKVDVYSFGIIMWELLTGEEPYGNMRSEEIIGGIIKGDLRPEVPTWCDPAWRSLMQRCWSSEPDSRPAFSEIAKELRAMSAAMNIK